MNIDVKKVKIIVTVPVANINEVRNAICSEGAGVIGNYTYCTTSTKCIGTFIPSENANPYIGEKENYGRVIIIEGIDGVEIWYGFIESTTVNLYDYVEKNSYLGQTEENILFLAYKKDGTFLNYKEYLK